MSTLLQVLDFELQRQLVPYMKDMVPLPGIYDPDFIAANQDTRADNLIKGSRREQLETVRQHIRDFQQRTQVGALSTLSVQSLLTVVWLMRVSQALLSWKKIRTRTRTRGKKQCL